MLLDVARQDGRIDGDELQAAIGLAEGQLSFAEDRRAALEQLFREVAAQAIPLQQACETLTAALDVDARVALLQGLYSVATTDGERHRAERARIRHIAERLQLPPAARATAIVRALGSVALCYELLEVSPSATDPEIEAAYRRRSREVTDPEEQRQLRTAWDELRQLRNLT